MSKVFLRFKKGYILCLVFCLFIYSSSVSVLASAKTKDENNKSEEFLYLDNGDDKNINKSDLQEAKSNPNVAVEDIDEVDVEDIIDKTFVIVDFDNLNTDKETLKLVKDVLCSGKMIFVRAKAYTANESILYKIIGYKQNSGEAIVENDEALKERVNTIGYVVFLDDNNCLQISRQRIVNVNDQVLEKLQDYKEDNKNQLSKQEIEFIKQEINELNKQENNVNLGIDQEIKCMEEFSSYMTPTVEYINEADSGKVMPQGFDTGHNYTKIVDTVYCVYENKTMGAMTLRLYASRLYPKAKWNGKAPSNVSSSTTTKWAYKAELEMSPRWSKQSAKNNKLNLVMRTYATDSTAWTYQQVVFDYLPKTEISGSTEITYSLGASGSKEGAKVSGGATWTQKMPDVDFTVDYAAGKKTKLNYASWTYYINMGMRLNPKNVAQSTICLPGSVVVYNYSKNRCAINVKFTGTWYINGGTFNWSDYLVSTSDYYSWRLPVH